jgi:hypothetical protein
MINHIRKTLFLICLISLLAVVSSAQQKNEPASCTNQLIYPNADLDNFESPITGNVKQILIQETDLTDNAQSDLVQTINYNEQGNITDSFLTDSKIKVFGKTIYSYDDKNRLIRKVTYNPNGSAAIEDIFKYDSGGNLMQDITRNPQSKVIIWQKDFSYDTKKNYTKFFDKLHGYGFGFVKDAKCRMTEVTSYKSDQTESSKAVINYDDQKNIVELTVYSASSGKVVNKKKSEFEFDERGNWITQIKYELSLENDKVVYKPVARINRKIIYFDTK